MVERVALGRVVDRQPGDVRRGLVQPQLAAGELASTRARRACRPRRPPGPPRSGSPATVPSSSASTGISIFIDSRITTVSPSSTVSPTSTSIFHTVPVMWASTFATRASSSARRGQDGDDIFAGAWRRRPPTSRRSARRSTRTRARRSTSTASTSGRARASPTGSTRPCGSSTSLYGVDVLPRARHRRRERAGRRAGDPRAEPLLVHGPLLRRRVHPPARALHGQVAAVQAADAVDLHATAACSPCGAATRTRRRSSPRTAILERGGAIVMYCEGGRSRTGQLSDEPGAASAGWRWSPARRSCRWRSTARCRCATGSGCSSRRSRVRYGEPMRWERSPSRRATSSRRSRTRSSGGSRGSTRRSRVACSGRGS